MRNCSILSANAPWCHIVLLSAILFCSAGFNGHDCLLRAICEAAEIPLGLHNGVLGDIMHIILTYAVYFCLSYSRHKGTIECNNSISINFSLVIGHRHRPMRIYSMIFMMPKLMECWICAIFTVKIVPKVYWIGLACWNSYDLWQ